MDNITDEERKVMDELRKRTLHDLTPKLLEDSTVFYRFAKARDFNLAEAEAMLRKHISWRKEYEIDTILTDYTPPEVLLEYGASSFVCFDEEGSAVRIQDWGHLDGKGLINITTKTELAKIWFYFAEKDRAEVIKRRGNIGKPIFSPIYDLMDMSYAQAVNVKVLQYLVFGVKLLLDNYPECVKTITIINAPFYFHWTYTVIKPVFPYSVTQKMRIFAKDGWKEVLLKDIDAKNLPSYLGGHKTDPDGNPLCKTFIQHGKPIPKSCYRPKEVKKLVLESDVEKLIVMPFTKEEITFKVKEEYSTIEWEFEIKKGDIDFCLRFEEEILEDAEPFELIPKHRIDTSFEYEKGYFKCDKIGIYTIVFDNSYSWLHSKEIYYRAGIKNLKNKELYEST